MHLAAYRFRTCQHSSCRASWAQICICSRIGKSRAFQSNIPNRKLFRQIYTTVLWLTSSSILSIYNNMRWHQSSSPESSRCSCESLVNVAAQRQACSFAVGFPRLYRRRRLILAAFGFQIISHDTVHNPATRYSGCTSSSRSTQCSDFNPRNTIQHGAIRKLPVETVAPAGKVNRGGSELSDLQL